MQVIAQSEWQEQASLLARGVQTGAFWGEMLAVLVWV